MKSFSGEYESIALKDRKVQLPKEIADVFIKAHSVSNVLEDKIPIVILQDSDKNNGCIYPHLTLAYKDDADIFEGKSLTREENIIIQQAKDKLDYIIDLTLDEIRHLNQLQYGQPRHDQPQHDQLQYGQPQHDQPRHGQPQQVTLLGIGKVIEIWNIDTWRKYKSMYSELIKFDRVSQEAFLESRNLF